MFSESSEISIFRNRENITKIFAKIFEFLASKNAIFGLIWTKYGKNWPLLVRYVASITMSLQFYSYIWINYYVASILLLCRFNSITMSLQFYYYVASILLLCCFNSIAIASTTVLLHLYYYVASITMSIQLLCRFNYYVASIL